MAVVDRPDIGETQRQFVAEDALANAFMPASHLRTHFASEPVAGCPYVANVLLLVCTPPRW